MDAKPGVLVVGPESSETSRLAGSLRDAGYAVVVMVGDGADARRLAAAADGAALLVVLVE
ncbi:MAG: hypothetical protein AB7V42_06095 [Thermoleophilia bacterium]